LTGVTPIRLAAAVAALALAAPASAAAPRFALLDLHDLVRASRNAFGDVRPTRTPPHAPLVVHCVRGCRFGAGWLGFTGRVGPSGGDIVAASAVSGRLGWSLRLTLSSRGRSAWTRFARAARLREKRVGVPDVLAVAIAGRVLAVPFSNDVVLSDGRLDLPGFSRANARLAAKSF
jgi:hypothetical protein